MYNQANDWDLFRKDQKISGVAMHDYQKIQSIYSGYINPSIIEERSMNITQLDIFSRLMMDRIIFLGTAIDDTVSNIITAQLLFLHSTDSEKHIDMYIQSPGGGIYAGYSIYDTMNFIDPDVNTLVTGMAASMGFILSINGAKRSCLKHSRLMLHQPLGQASGQASDIEIRYRQIQKLKEETNGIISEKCNQPIEKVTIDADRDFWMTSYEAKEYGAIDKIIGEDD